MKVCANCKHYRRQALRSTPNICLRAVTVTQPDIVTGKATEYYASCESERAKRRTIISLFVRDDRCGPEGRYFEPKDAGGRKSAKTKHLPAPPAHG